jgi:hypothetical protein
LIVVTHSTIWQNIFASDPVLLFADTNPGASRFDQPRREMYKSIQDGERKRRRSTRPRTHADKTILRVALTAPMVAAVLWITNINVVRGNLADTLAQLRSGSSDSANSNVPLHFQSRSQNDWGKKHVIRRLHENPVVRQNIADIQERMYRYQTGLPPDPNHIVPYDNHPFDVMKRQRRERFLIGHRRAADNSTSETDDSVNVSNSTKDESNYTAYEGSQFRPMRITFETVALDSIRTSDNSAKIDWFKAEVLPRTAEFWSKALSVGT